MRLFDFSPYKPCSIVAFLSHTHQRLSGEDISGFASFPSSKSHQRSSSRTFIIRGFQLHSGLISSKTFTCIEITMAFGKVSNDSHARATKTQNVTSFSNQFQPKAYRLSRSPSPQELIQILGKDQLFSHWWSEFPQANASLGKSVYTPNMARSDLLELQQDIQDALTSLTELQEVSMTYQQTVWYYLDSQFQSALRRECVHFEKLNELAESVAERLKDLLAMGGLITRYGDIRGPQIFHAAVVETVRWCRIAETELYQSHTLLEPYRTNDYTLAFTKPKPSRNPIGFSELRGAWRDFATEYLRPQDSVSSALRVARETHHF